MGCDINLSISDWIQISISASTFLAVIFALFGHRFREYLDGPKISLEFNKTSERCFRWAIASTDTLQDQGQFSNVKRQYFRLRVVNSGHTIARQLKAKIELYTSDKKLADRFEPSTLHWISGLETINLASGEDWYLDLLSQVIEPDSIKYKLRIELADKTPRGIAWDRYLDDYILRVSLHGENLYKPMVRFFSFSSANAQVGDLKEIWKD